MASSVIELDQREPAQTVAPLQREVLQSATFLLLVMLAVAPF
jgi:hypothetical protein